MAGLLRIRGASQFLVGAFLLILAAGAHAALTFPALTGRVVDEAGILSAQTKAQVAEISADAERRVGAQIVVATVKSLQDVPIEDYGYQLGRFWGIGQKDKNNGVILLVAPNDRQMRIEVGYGLEGQLTDAQSKVIIERVIAPRFRNGDFDAGVLAGTAAIFQVMTGAAPTLPDGAVLPDHQQSSDVFGFLPLLILLFIFFGGRGLLWPMLFMGGGGWSGGRGGGFSDGGDGGFSGGGGSFGGGGASGKW